MYLTTALNLFWGLLAVLAFGFYALSDAGHGPRTRRAGAWRRLSAVAIIVLALFPCISVSDDVCGYARLTPKTLPGSSVQDPVSAQLARLLQSIEQIQVAEIFALVISLSSFALVAISWFEFHAQLLPVLPGRAPPLD